MTGMVVPVLYRVMEPARMKESRPAKVHYEALDGRLLLCGLTTIFTRVDGQDIRMWHRTDREMNCGSCRKALEVIVRMQLRGLPAADLEDLLTRIGELGNTARETSG